LEYRARVFPTKAVRTRSDNEKELAWLLRFFGDPPAPLDSIEPLHVRQYMDWRAAEARKLAEGKNAERKLAGNPPIALAENLGQVRANREKALFSHMWNFAREQGLTKSPNPCAGICGFKEQGRDVVISDELLEKINTHASEPLQFA